MKRTPGMSSRAVVALLAGLILITLWPQVAAARPTAAVAPTEGDGGREVDEILVGAIADDVSVSGAREVRKTADKLGLADRLSDRDLLKVAIELDVDVVLAGRLSREGGARSLHVSVVAKAGKKPRGFTVHFGDVRSEKFKRALRDALLAKLDVGRDGGERAAGRGDRGDKKADRGDQPDRGDRADRDADTGRGRSDSRARRNRDRDGDRDDADRDDADREDRGGSADRDDGSRRRRGRNARRRDDGEGEADDDGPRRRGRTAHRHDDEDDGGGEDDDRDAEDAPRPRGRTAGRVGIRAEAGVSASTRSLTWNSRAFPQAPLPYSNSAVPGARFAAELYPLAFASPHGVAGGLGLGIEVDQTLSLNLRTSTQPGTPLPATQRHWSVSGLFRVGFGHAATSPSLVLGVAFGHRTFAIDRSGLTMGNTLDLPDVDYTFVAPGAQFRLPLARSVALSLGGRGLLMLNAGDIQSTTQYGQATITGVDASLGIEIMLGQRFAIRLAAEGTLIGFSFAGNGQLANNRDGDPSTKDVGGASDRYLGGVGSLEVLY